MTQSEFEKIYRKHFRAVHNYLLKLSCKEQLADELTSDTFFKAMGAIDRFEGKCDIQSWLCQIAKNSYFSYLKNAGRMVPIDSVLEKADDKSGPEGQAVNQDSSIRILKTLHSIPEPYKEVFSLRVFAELSFRQIAEIFGKTENWACVTYHRAKSKIQTIMEEEK